jgi:hypothetical protein
LINKLAFHWLALDLNGQAPAGVYGEHDGGTFQRVTPADAIPAVILSSDFPVAVGPDGSTYYVPYRKDGPRELIRRNARRTVVARLPEASNRSMQWVNGIIPGPDGSFYVTDNDAVLKIDSQGVVSSLFTGIVAPECSSELADVPQLPYLRGLALEDDGSLIVAASGCRAVIRITPSGSLTTILKAEPPWSPTAVAVFGNSIYVLEYLHEGEDRIAWVPRVRKIDADGRVSLLAIVKRSPP